MEIRTLWIFQVNSDMNKITDVTPLTKVDSQPAARNLIPFFSIGDVSSWRFVTSRGDVKYNIPMISGNERSAPCLNWKRLLLFGH
jgi:hypothetical protein